MTHRAVEEIDGPVALVRVMILGPLAHVPGALTVAVVAGVTQQVLNVGEEGSLELLTSDEFLYGGLNEGDKARLDEQSTLSDILVVVKRLVEGLLAFRLRWVDIEQRIKLIIFMFI